MNPSRSQVKIFNLSPRRERKTNKLSPTGSWPMTVFTRSARLGSPIIPRSQGQPAKYANDSHRIQAQPKGCVSCSGESQSPDYVLAPVVPWAPLLSLLQTSPFRLRESASSNRKKANPADYGHDRTPLQSDRSDSAQKPVHATSSTTPPSVVSSHKIDASRRRKQEGVKIALTIDAAGIRRKPA